MSSASTQQSSILPGVNGECGYQHAVEPCLPYKGGLCCSLNGCVKASFLGFLCWGNFQLIDTSPTDIAGLMRSSQSLLLDTTMNKCMMHITIYPLKCSYLTVAKLSNEQRMPIWLYRYFIIGGISTFHTAFVNDVLPSTAKTQPTATTTTTSSTTSDV